MSLELQISGFLFWLIIATNLSSDMFGGETYSDLDIRKKLNKINESYKNFKISFVFIIIEHLSLIAVVVMLFIGLNSYNLFLALIWLLTRSTEGIIQIFDKKDYWKLLDLAKKTLGLAEDVLHEAFDEGISILKRKNHIFTIGQMLFSIGTLSYSILFVLIDLIPSFFGWFGIFAAVVYGLGNGMRLYGRDSIAVWGSGGLMILIFEFLLGGWLLFFL